MFCRETCEVTINSKSEKIVGKGKVVQIDENKGWKEEVPQRAQSERTVVALKKILVNVLLLLWKTEVRQLYFQ